MDEINDAKPVLEPKHQTFFTLTLKPGKISTALLGMHFVHNALCVDLLLKAGADVNMADIHGNTALGYAAYYGQHDLARMLIKSGADVNTSGQNGITPIFLAAQAGHNDCLEEATLCRS